MNPSIAFIGGGNMASALIGGLLQHGTPAAQITVVEPQAEARARLAALGLQVLPEAQAALGQAGLVVWAVKPQTFHAAAQAVRAHVPQALHLSVAAGLRSSQIGAWLGSTRVVRAMPNTPALIGKGITALYAPAHLNAADRAWAQAVIAPTGEWLWLDAEEHMDAVTAVSGSGPAYVFYVMEAMAQAGQAMGLTAAQAHQLTVATLIGAGELARQSTEPPAVLRQRVTSKGGTTEAAIQALEHGKLQALIGQAMWQAHQRSRSLGDELGAA